MNSKILSCSLAVLLAFAACSSPEAPSESAEVQETVPALAAPQEYDVEQLKQQVDAKEVLLVDVRRTDEIEEHGAIEGSVHIPMEEFEARMAELPKDQPIAVYCMRGGRASRAADTLHENGYKDVKYGGITAWKEQGYSVTYPEGAAGGTE